MKSALSKAVTSICLCATPIVSVGASLDQVVIQDLQKHLIVEEGYRRYPYRDPVGILTVGIGRNLETNGLSYDEAVFLLVNDIKMAEKHLTSEFPWFNHLTNDRKMVLLNMTFNMGIKRLKTFKKFIAALEREDYKTASKEMLSSYWATQVGVRAKDLAAIMEEG